MNFPFVSALYLVSFSSNVYVYLSVLSKSSLSSSPDTAVSCNLSYSSFEILTYLSASLTIFDTFVFLSVEIVGFLIVNTIEPILLVNPAFTVQVSKFASAKSLKSWSGILSNISLIFA